MFYWIERLEMCPKDTDDPAEQLKRKLLMPSQMQMETCGWTDVLTDGHLLGIQY